MKEMPFCKNYIIPTLILCLLASCKRDFSGDNYVAYFGGEVANPTCSYVLFCKDNVVIDTIQLNKDNTFFKKFDSLTPGLYTFKHNPEYQYVYFDKNDSIKVHIDSKDFDESIIFCGRGDQKNNYLMDMYMRNEKDRNNMFESFDYSFEKYNSFIDKTNKDNTNFYKSKKEEIKWNDEFDVYAKAIVQFPYYTKKEIYPFIHKMRTGEDVHDKLPKDYYTYRNNIDYSNEALTEFSPFVMYLDHMLNNVGAINYHNHFSDVDLALKENINKLNIADSLITNEKVKNIVLNNIALKYLLEDQNMVNNQEFLKTYHKYSTDKSKKNEILKIGNAIQLLTIGKKLPEVELIDSNGKTISSDAVINKNTVFFFWSEKLNSHLVASHKKVLDLKKKYPNYEFIAINLDDDQEQWKLALKKYNFGTIKEFKCSNFDDIKAKWAITKVHRILVVNADKTIKNGFTNLFDLNFESNLK
ncbi:thioredoxin-like domain-containing protein [Flavobacterium sp. SUN052]|uniref:TlpA family protein disulfide reductase n=1 Tax=Flavobacterium sp. SUN052 TaxID=3002441 RepID=UPI00237E0FC3|nr:thioredoxin-like domain-containing protein [Flavobacterium sp. SUN052]MEC4005856.1 thioredoxin-like domain-containing protein [Flavobacterium sp. SUN052]